MIASPKQTHIAFRCPECGEVVFGLVGKFALAAGMVRLKCHCGASALDITVNNDKKLRISVPCIFCKQNHNYIVSQNVFFENDIFLLNCPYANMDIAFIGVKEAVDTELSRTEKELIKLLTDLEAEKLGDIQPIDVDEEEILCDPTVYDTIRFVVKDLEAEGKVKCPCGEGRYELRYCKNGLQVYCENCGATYTFDTTAEAASVDYINTEEINLS